ncbi:hypothetical protein MMC16_000801 [Acarospora aff. strigata]|nr:hypothetical protein [Acarospora aff. strigata]
MPESHTTGLGHDGSVAAGRNAQTSIFMAPSPQQAKHWAKQYRTEIAASSSSVLSTFVAVGALAPLASVTLVRTVSFSIYQKAKYKYSAAIARTTGGEEPLVIINRSGSYPTIATLACFGAAGATAGAIITAIACPFELTKLSAQISVLMARTNTSSVDDPVRRSYQQKGTFKTAKTIIKHRGVRGLYSGFHLHLLRDTIGTAIYFMTYESGKQLMATFQGSTNTSPLPVAIAGGLCGLVSWACIYPIDSAKTHYQRNCLTKARGQPVKMPKIQFFNSGMYRGLGVSMARSCIINMIFFSSFEIVKKRINQLQDPIDP